MVHQLSVFEACPCEGYSGRFLFLVEGLRVERNAEAAMYIERSTCETGEKQS